jgi:hypothetical protein
MFGEHELSTFSMRVAKSTPNYMASLQLGMFDAVGKRIGPMPGRHSTIQMPVWNVALARVSRSFIILRRIPGEGAPLDVGELMPEHDHRLIQHGLPACGTGPKSIRLGHARRAWAATRD